MERVIVKKTDNKYDYYDGHYTDSGFSLEEREKIEKESLEKNSKLTEWTNPNTD